MKHKRIILWIWLWSSFSLITYAEPPIQLIYWKPLDVQAPSQADLDSFYKVMVEVQAFFASEMERHGFGPKTFDFNSEVSVIRGKLERKGYNSGPLTLHKENPSLLKHGLDNQIYVVFLGGEGPISRGSAAAQKLCANIPEQLKYCNNLVVVPAENKRLLEVLLAHEIGHAFNIDDHAPNRLILNRVDVMYLPLVVIPGVKESLDNYVLNRKDAVFLDRDDRLFIQQASQASTDAIDDDYIYLTFTYNRSDTLTPTNPHHEWNGWTQGVWEKYPNKSTTRFPFWSLEFPEMDNLEHWMYSHAPSTITYDISNKDVMSFGAYFLTPNSNCGPSGGSMEFIAYTDNTKIYSQKLGLADNGTYITFNIPKGSQVFRIEIGDLGQNSCDHYVLGEPRLYHGQGNSVAQQEIDADVNNDGSVDLSDVKIVRSAIQNRVSYDTDVNNDGKTDEIDVLIVKQKAMEAIVAAAPSLIKRKKITTWGSLKARKP